MLWLNPKQGTLECGCQVDGSMTLTALCPAHSGVDSACEPKPVKLQQFALDAAATQRRTNVDLASTRAALKQAQVQRHQMSLKLRSKRG